MGEEERGEGGDPSVAGGTGCCAPIRSGEWRPVAHAQVSKTTIASGAKRALVHLPETGIGVDDDPHASPLVNEGRNAAFAGDPELVVWADEVAGALDDLWMEGGLRQCWAALSRMNLTPDSDLSLLNDPEMPLEGLIQKCLREAP